MIITVVVFLLVVFLFTRQQENFLPPLTYEQVIAGSPQLLKPPFNRPYKKYNGMNFPGGDLENQYVNNSKECEVLCTHYSFGYDNPRCVAYAIATKGDPAHQGKRMCYLKRREVVNSTQATKDPNWNSGVQPGYFYY